MKISIWIKHEASVLSQRELSLYIRAIQMETLCVGMSSGKLASCVATTLDCFLELRASIYSRLVLATFMVPSEKRKNYLVAGRATFGLIRVCKKYIDDDAAQHIVELWELFPDYEKVTGMDGEKIKTGGFPSYSEE